MSTGAISASKQPRSVAFSQFSELAFIPRDEPEAKWYSGLEKSRLRRALIDDVRRISKTINGASPADITPDHLHECLGVEMFVTPNLAKQIEEKKRAHAKAVLLEQRLQATQGICNNEHLSLVSMNSSGWSRTRAHDLARGYQNLD